MPVATLNGPTIENLDVKRVLVKEITDALEKAYKLPRHTYIVLIKEDSPNNVGVGGELVIDREKK
ncbi:MAG TPA: 4-oxalocrotonate tautomerase [archaeon]|nr:4-oxalocrotonate tautomerase [archaeon]